ncbi:hypothetical protein B296_00027281 [Ensete ventricosum]|uniref:Uncharacterized protein n=1 Tax=Ensete ventricosum TaxID=4639 RepID=A0A426XHB4_ENSVE|nr:hypothetical protein B296_00027281 [Ensete ventricosum]
MHPLRFPNTSTLAATSRYHLLPSSSIAIATASSSSLQLSSARPQQHTASINTAASLTAFLVFCPLFHIALSLTTFRALPPLPPTDRHYPSPACCCSNAPPQPSLATIAAPLQSRPLLVASPLLPALTNATCR